MLWSRFTRRCLVWLRRYGPSELLGTAVALAAAALAFELGGSVAAAFAATWAEFLAYYGLMVWRTLRESGPFSPRTALITVRNLLLEFGPAELLDSMLIRPAALYAAISLAPMLALGTLLGKLVADVCFYVPTVIAYELRVRLLPERGGSEGA